MTVTPIQPGADGLYHPNSEAEVIALIKLARAQGLQVRARGAAHSVAWSIYTDPQDGRPLNRTLEQTPPEGGINIAFDKMRALEWIDEKAGIIEAGPGINLGHDPEDPFGVSTRKNSLLHQIFEKGWAVPIVGGITHQTLAGFTATGSAGGSTTYSWDLVIAYRVVDGTGKAQWIDDKHKDFDAFGTSMGLLGIVTRFRLQLVPMFNIEGSEVTTPLTRIGSGLQPPMDFFGDGEPGWPSLEDYFKQTPYTRITWSPQSGAERIQIWKATPVPFSSEDLTPYAQFSGFAGQTEQYIASLIFVIAGNTDPARIIKLVWQKTGFYLEGLGKQLHRSEGSDVTRFFTYLLGCVIAIVGLLAGIVLAFFSGLVRSAYHKLLPIFSPMTKPGEELNFSDWYWRSLCMDNTVSDDLLGTEFTEIWVPISRAKKVVNLLREMFEKGGDEATGYFATEVYAGAPTSGWMHPGYTDGSDDYKDGAIRIDVYWFRDNAGRPNADKAFFDQYWDVLRDNGIPFRLHWGKFVPRYDFAGWAAFYKANLPRFEDFMKLRAKRDPDDVFFTQYWKLRLTGTA